MLYFSFFFGLLLYIIIIHAGFIQDKLFDGKVLHIDRVSADCRGEKVPCQGFFQGMKAVSTIIFIENFTLVVKEGGFKKLLLTVTIDRCRSKENLDTCEEIFKQPNIDLCKALDPKNIITRQAVLGFPLVPSVKCPMEKGVYHAYNFSYDIAPFIFFNMEGWYWKTKSDVVSSDQNRLIFCMHTAGYVTKSKLKKQ